MTYIARTPKAITDEIKLFCKSLSPTADPVRIPYTYHDSAKMGHCYHNVTNYIAEQGGEVQYGFSIWELPNAYLYGEHHAVVKVDGELIDITPALGDKELLFQPTAVEFVGQPLVGRYHPLHPSERIRRLCELSARRVALAYQGKRGNAEDKKLAIEEQKILDFHFEKLKKSNRR